MKNTRHHLAQFWADERSLSLLLVLTVIEFFVLPPMRGLGTQMPILGQLAFALLLVSGVQSVSQRRSIRLSAGLLVGLTWFINYFRHLSATMQLLDYLSTGVVLSMFVVVILRRVLGDGESNSFRIQGAIAAYILLAVIWGHFYALISASTPGSFTAPPGYLEPERLLESMTFFSSVTLTTVGYGDITPVAPLARSLACLEMYLGVLYPAILVGRLVALNLPTPAPLPQESAAASRTQMPANSTNV